jgi:hypothetical protein
VDLGTRFAARDAGAAGTTVVVLAGSVLASTDVGETKLAAGQEVRLARRTSPPGRVRAARDLERRLSWADGIDRLAVDLARAVAHSGDWRVLPGSRVSLATVERLDAFFLLGEQDWRDYTLTARAVLEEKDRGDYYGVGLCGYWQNEREVLRLRYLFSQWEVVEGYRKDVRVLGSFPAQLEPGADLRMKFELQTVEGGVRVRAKVWPSARTEPAAWGIAAVHPFMGHRSGRPGLYGYKCKALFSEVEVRPLPKGRAALASP